MKTFKEYLEEGQQEFTNAMNNIPAEKRDSARKQYTALRKKGHTHAAAMTYMFNLHKKETELDEDWKKVAMGAAIAATVVTGGARGIQNNREVEKLEQQHSVLVQKNPKKAEQLRHHLDQAKAVKGNAKLNGQFDHHIQQAKSIAEETELQEMGDTTKGKSTLANYIKKRSAEVANDAAHDALHAGTNIKGDDKTVYGLDPVTKQPITKKPRPRFAEHKKLTGIARAADRLAK
jgi:predicted transcriptional regulator